MTRPAADDVTANSAAETLRSVPTAERLLERYAVARARRSDWEAHWQDCYDFALPRGGTFTRRAVPGDRRGDRLFDATASDAVDQLAASLLAQLTPPWSRWFGLAPGPDLSDVERDAIAPLLDRAAATLQSHFDRSNFAVEMHQCYLDLVTGGTACLLFEEAPPGELSCFRFAAVPLADAVLEEGAGGRLDGTFRRVEMTVAEMRHRFGAVPLPPDVAEAGARDPGLRFGVLEAVLPDGEAYHYAVILEAAGGAPTILAEGRFGLSPFINFRWLKAPGEVYGRSPVMKALPDIKTANKVVELILKNASIAVTGIWQADDDGVLNPATVRLVPGTIIPKAVGSSGLSPLGAPGRFDVGQLVLDDLRARIRHALLADRLAPVADQRMTATEVLERAGEMARLLGATYGRLQSELLTPLILRAMAILRRRGEIPDIPLDGRLVTLQYRSPLAQAQAQRDVQSTLRWIEAAGAMGPEALAVVDLAAAARWLGESFGVPGELIRAAASSAAEPDIDATAGATAVATAGPVLDPDTHPDGDPVADALEAGLEVLETVAGVADV